MKRRPVTHRRRTRRDRRLTAVAIAIFAGVSTTGIVVAQDDPAPTTTTTDDMVSRFCDAVDIRDLKHAADELRIAELEAALANATSTTSTSTTAAPTTAPATEPSTSTTTSTTTTVAPPMTTQQPPPPSGVAMPTGDLVGWRYLMGEDFRTDAPLGAFTTTYPNIGVYPNTYYDTSRNTNRPAAQWGQYDPARVLSVSGGVLSKWIHTEGTRPKVAAIAPFIPNRNRTSPTDWTDQLYGRYSVRYRVPNALPGYKQAWLLWPESNDGRAQGEIDFPETDFNVLTHVGGFMHHINGVSGSDQYAMPRLATDLRQWHTATIEWSPNLVRFLWDGVEAGRTTNRIPNTPMHWVLQTETTITSAAPAASVSGEVLIDWVAMWGWAA
jgi:hypothetical protein